MAYQNCLDYLERRGVLPFSLAPFCEVDNLILSVCAYIAFDGAAPSLNSGKFLPFPKVVNRLDDKRDWNKMGVLLDEQIPLLLENAAACPRFAALKIGCYESLLDEETGMQFAALTYRLPDGTLYVAFRGTDDTLLGWKECFSMSFSEAVPAQRRAEAYLAAVADRHPGKLRLGGHSKGGNLAVWAAVHASPTVRRRILHVYSNDGPGFSRDLTRSPEYRALAGRITTFIPQGSIVGTLLHQDSRYRVIKSHQTGAVGQHDPFSWEVRGTAFRYLPRRSRMGLRSTASLQGWVASMDAQEREEFTEVFFGLLGSTNAKTLSELTASLVDSTFTVIKSYADLDRTTRREMRDYLWRLLVNLGTGGRPQVHGPRRRWFPRHRR